MMKKIRIIQLGLIALISGAVFFTSCKAEDDLGTPGRLFRPVFTETVFGVTWIKVKWDRYQGAQTFELQLSADNFQTILQDVATDSIAYTFEGLEYDTQYRIRIRSLGDNIRSEYMEESVSTLKWPTKLKDPVAADCIDRQIRVRWTEEIYDSLTIYQGKSDWVRTVALTAEDNEAQVIIIRDLQPTTAYIVRAYKDGAFLGEVAYATLAEQIFEGDYVDLRSLTAEEAYSKLTQSYFDELATQYSNGVTVVLAGGTHYEIGTVNLSVNLKLVTGLSLEGNAIMEEKGSFAVADGVTVDFIVLENLIFTDHINNPRDAANFGGCYIFNFNKAGGKVNDLQITNCDIRYKRGVLRAQVATEIGKITIDKCLFDSIGGYGITNADHTDAYFKEIIVKNSTIAHAEKILVVSKPTQTPNTVSMENLTVCYAPKGEGNYILDFNNQAIPGGVSIKNCLFGAGWGSKIRGMRSAAANLTVDKSYRTSDMEWSLDASNNPNSPVDDLIQLSESSTAIFENPQQVNFKVTNATLVNKIGDPRWW